MFGPVVVVMVVVIMVVIVAMGDDDSVRSRTTTIRFARMKTELFLLGWVAIVWSVFPLLLSSY
jgi:hypothetical protein